MRCSVQTCTNDTKNTKKRHGITFHMFPKEPNLCNAWINALGFSDWEPKAHSSICSEHFRNEDFYETRYGLREIKNGAIPMVQDNLEDLDAPAVLRVCRICLSMDRKMYHIKEHKLDLAYKQVIGTSLSDEDKLPQKLCWECAHRLLNCDRFKSKTLTSQTILTDILHNHQYIRIQDIKCINRSHKQLKSTLTHSHFEINDYNFHMRDNIFIVKLETENDEVFDEKDRLDHEKDEIDEEKNGIGDVKDEINDGKDELKEETPIIPPIMEVEIKDERSYRELFFDEYGDRFDDTDNDKKLSEVYATKDKVKKKVMKKKIKTVSNKDIKPKRDEDDSPLTTIDKYKKADVKRRKPQDTLDKSLFTITTLTYEEQIAEIQKRQETTTYIKAAYKCTICYRGFHIKDRYDGHIVRHSDQSGAYECFICKTRLKTGGALRKHLTAQHTEKISCKRCPFVTKNRAMAREHEKWHAGNKYQCPHCPSEFDKSTTYLSHIRIKHVSDFVCELCGYTFVSKKGIDVHKKIKHRLADKMVTEDGPYCEVCDVRFVSEEAHSRHLKLSSRHSSDNDPNRIRNDSQNLNAERDGRVMRRIKGRSVIHPREHGDKKKRNGPSGPMSCEQCGIQLRDLRLYAQHFRRAHPDKNRTKYPAIITPCMCEQCGKLFQSIPLLKNHMWVHTGEKQFKCDRCEKSFTQKATLVCHMQVHSATRPTYECPLCGKHLFFKNRSRHMFTHTGIKPFKCEACGKCFTTSNERKAHVEHVHMKKPWPKRARSQRQPSRDVNKVVENMED